MSEINKPGLFYGYIIVLFSFLILMTVWGAQYSFGVFFKPMLNEFGFSRAALSGAYSIGLVIQSVACILTGKLCDRYGPRLVVTVCGSLLGISYVLMSQVQAIWQIYIIFGVFSSIGVAGTWVPLLSTISRWFVHRRGLMSGITSAGVGAGVMLVPALSSFLIANFGWRTSYIMIGLTVLILVIASAQMLKRDPSEIGQSALGTSAHHDHPSLHFTFKEALASTQFWLVCGVFVMMGSSLQSVLVHIVPHATDVGIAEVTAATIISVIGAVSIISKVSLGVVIDRLGSKPVAVMIGALMLASFTIIQLSDTLWVLYVFAVIFAFGYGGFAAIQSPFLAELFGLKYHGTIFGFTMFIIGLGAFGPFIAGKIFDATLSYRLAFVMLAVMSSLAILFALGIKKTHLAKK
ncbi:MAG: MFS transporter [Deltaproteobacteria bacterium]|nr:MFS transporter [Deltaproteobacteria bacterium]